MKRPFETILEITRENLPKSAKNDRRNQEFLHQFIIWLLSFAVGGLYVIISTYTEKKSALSYCTVKLIVIFLTISIISGILSRIFLYLFQVIYNSNMFFAEGALSDSVIMEVNPQDVSKENDVEKLISLLKDDFDQDEPEVLKLYNEANETGKILLINTLRKKYNDLGIWAKKDYEIGTTHIKAVMSKAFGLTEKEIAKQSELSSGKIRFFRYAFTCMLYISCLAFIIAYLF